MPKHKEQDLPQKQLKLVEKKITVVKNLRAQHNKKE